MTTASYQCGTEHFERIGLSEADARSALMSTTTIARRAVEGTSTRVAASVGPFGASLANGSEYHGRYGVAPDVVSEYHRRKIAILMDSAPDVFAVETQPLADESGVIAEILRANGAPPAWFSFCFSDGESTCGGDTAERAFAAVADYPNLVAIGVNCTAPELVAPILRRFNRLSPKIPLIAYPNHGGRWRADDRRWTAPVGRHFDDEVEQWIDLGASFIGGCCGIGPVEIDRLARRVGDRQC